MFEQNICFHFIRSSKYHIMISFAVGCKKNSLQVNTRGFLYVNAKYSLIYSKLLLLL